MVQSEQNPSIVMDLQTASEFLGISPYLLRRLTRERIIPFVQLGKQYYYRKETLTSFLAKQEAANLAVPEGSTTSPTPIHATVPEPHSAVAPTASRPTLPRGIRRVQP